MSEFIRIREKTKIYQHHYETKRMIKILLLIDELYDKGFSLDWRFSDDVEKYGEEVVLSKEDHKKQLEDFLQIESNLQSILKEQEYGIKELISTLSFLIKEEERGESS